MSKQVQRSWDYVRDSTGAPIPTLIAVGAFSLILFIKNNVMGGEKHELLVEVFEKDDMLPKTDFYVPRMWLMTEDNVNRIVEKAQAKRRIRA